MCDMGRQGRATRTFARAPTLSGSHARDVELVIGLACGALAYALTRGPRPVDPRRRSMTEAEAVGHRAALGEDPTSMRMREDRHRSTCRDRSAT